MHCYYRICCLLIVLLVMVSCASSQQSQTQAERADDSQTAWDMVQLPPLPDGRSASVALVDILDGSQASQHSTNAEVVDSDLVLTSGSNVISWGIWEFNPALNYLTSVEIMMSVPEGQEAYIALADYSRGIWEHDGPVTGGKLLLLDDARHKSADGLCYIAVLVAGGDQATVNQVILNTDDGWTITTAKTNASAAFLSMAIVDGHPMIAYHVNGVSLKYTRAMDPYGLAWASAKSIDIDGDVGDFCSLAVVNGNPAVAYYDNDDDDLLFVRAEDSTGTSWLEPVIASFGGDSGTFNSLLVADGFPIISHYQADESYVACAEAVDANGAEWDTPHVIDNDGSTGMHGSMAIINGFPAASYQSDQHLRFARAGNVGGTMWPNLSKQTIDDQLGAGYYTSLAWINGAPAISYWRADESDLCYIRGADADGDTWSAPKILDGDAGAETGLYSSLAAIGGVPAIAYYSNTGEDLYYIQARDADGVDWYAPMVVDSEGIVGSYCRLIEIDGMPGIAYRDTTANEIKFAIRQAP